MFRPSRKIFINYLPTNGLALNQFLPNADTHLAVFTIDNRGPVGRNSRKGYIMAVLHMYIRQTHAHLDNNELNYAAHIAESTYPLNRTVSRREFRRSLGDYIGRRFIRLTILQEQLSHGSHNRRFRILVYYIDYLFESIITSIDFISQFFQHVKEKVKDYAWYTYVKQWKGEKRNEWARSNLSADIKALIATEHEKKRETLTKEQLQEMAYLIAKKSALKKLESIKYNGSVEVSLLITLRKGWRSVMCYQTMRSGSFLTRQKGRLLKFTYIIRISSGPNLNSSMRIGSRTFFG
jgi:hypothetical protein